MASVRFGIFEFDPTARELRRDGVPVRLQAQPAQVLTMLLEHPGQVVTREALRAAVWGTDTFVDFERGLNFCIAQIRSALGDSAKSPRFIRTIPKLGYQFVAPAGAESAPRRSAKPRIIAAVLAASALLAAALLWWRASSTAQDTTIAVERFENQTGSPDFDRFTAGLTDSVVAELTSALNGRYSIIGNAAILRQPPGKRDLLAVGRSLNAGFVVIGQVQRNGAQFRILAHLIRLPAQKHLTVTRVDCTIDDPLRTELDVAQRVAADFSKRLPNSHDSAVH